MMKKIINSFKRKFTLQEKKKKKSIAMMVKHNCQGSVYSALPVVADIIFMMEKILCETRILEPVQEV